MRLRYDSMSSREVSQVSFFGLVEGQGGFSSADFISSREILKSLCVFIGFIFGTVLVIMTMDGIFFMHWFRTGILMRILCSMGSDGNGVVYYGCVYLGMMLAPDMRGLSGEWIARRRCWSSSISCSIVTCLHLL
jgi:hypothetical protein